MSTMLARQFKAFLPPKDKLDLGDPWWIIPSELNIFTGYLPNNRFYPPPPKGKEVRDATQFPCTWEVVCPPAQVDHGSPWSRQGCCILSPWTF